MRIDFEHDWDCARQKVMDAGVDLNKIRLSSTETTYEDELRFRWEAARRKLLKSGADLNIPIAPERNKNDQNTDK